MDRAVLSLMNGKRRNNLPRIPKQRLPTEICLKTAGRLLTSNSAKSLLVTGRVLICIPSTILSILICIPSNGGPDIEIGILEGIRLLREAPPASAAYMIVMTDGQGFMELSTAR